MPTEPGQVTTTTEHATGAWHRLTRATFRTLPTDLRRARENLHRLRRLTRHR